MGLWGTTNTTTTTEPWEGQQAYLEQIFNEAQRLYGGQFPTQMLAGFNPTEQEAQRRMLEWAYGPGTALANQAQGALGFLLSGDVLRPESNPYLAASAEGAMRPVSQALTEEWLPNIRSDAVQAGMLSSSNAGIAEGIAVDRAARTAGDITSNMYANAYNTGLGAYTQGLALSPQVMQLGMVPSSVASSVGAQQRAMTQAGYQQRYMQQLAPYLALQQYLSTVGGQYGGTSQTTQPASMWDWLFGGGGGLQGAAGGAAIGTMIYPGWGTAIGAGLGASGALS